MKRAIVTGASGFVGANVARRLLAEGSEVHLFLRPGYQPWRIDAIRDNVGIHELHLHNSDEVTRVMERVRPDWIFHLAAYGNYSWDTNLAQMVQTNITGTMNLVDAALRTGFEAFIHTGSSSEYGWKDHPPQETEFLEPNSHYAVTKASATLFCRHMAQREKAPIRTLRLYSVYGPYEDPRRLMPTLVVQGLRGQFPQLVKPDTARDYIQVDDVVNACILAASTPGQQFGAVYNMGTGIQTTLRQVVEVARNVMEIKAEPEWGSMPQRVWDTSCWVADNRLIRQSLGWTPRFSFEEGFRELVKWFRDNPNQLAACKPQTMK